MSDIVVNTGSISGEITPKAAVTDGEVVRGRSLEGEVNRNTSAVKDYERLNNKPQVNGEELIGDKSTEDLKIIFSKTTAEWAALTELVSVRNAIYVYTDYKPIGTSGDYQPGIKIGDGLAYVVDLPFATMEDARITAEDIENWNNKVSVVLDGENLIFVR